MKKILAYIFATLLTLMLGIPALTLLLMMVVYDPLMFLTVVGFMVIFWGGIWGFAYLLEPTKYMTYDEECDLDYHEDRDRDRDRDRRTVKLIN